MPGRADVTALLTRHYHGLAARDTQSLRWKEFLGCSAFEHARLARLCGLRGPWVLLWGWRPALSRRLRARGACALRRLRTKLA